ncbi:MAG: hypothetical protein HYX52_07155 [Chloroflexi bacterium]|nr:hypothetical protein [Chloroflexota bacterium]
MSRILLTTPRAAADRVRVTGADRRLLEGALALLRKDPCDKRLRSFRLRGDPPWAHLCRLAFGHERAWRIVYALGPQYDQVTVIAIGRHTETADGIYRIVADLMGVPHASARDFDRARERCCADGQPARITRGVARQIRASTEPG